MDTLSFIHDGKKTDIETTPAQLDAGNMDKGDIPYEVLIGGKPLLNPDGTVFMITENKIKEFYQSGKRLIVGAT